MTKKEKLYTLTIRLTESQYFYVSSLSKKLNYPKSEIIRDWVEFQKVSRYAKSKPKNHL